jgi:hypothetical protein
MADWGYRLQNYAYNVITDDVGKEFNRHLTDWQVHSNKLVSYATRAHSNFQNQLESARKAMEAERQRNAQLAMFILSLVAGPALSFVSGALQYRLGPKLFGDRASTIRPAPTPRYNPPPPPKPPAVNAQKVPDPSTVQVPNPTGRVPLATRRIVKNPPPQPTKAPPGPQPQVKPKPLDIKVPDKIKAPTPVVFDPDFSKTKGKILGDLGSSLISAFMVLPRYIAKPPDRTKLENNINLVPDSANLVELDKNLDSCWKEAIATGQQAIQFFANTIREDSTWGDRLWAELIHGMVPGASYPRVSDPIQRFEHGKDWIRKTVNEQREAWAKQDGWLYYGHKPVDITEASTVNAIETELWALWIAQENFQKERITEYGSMDREGNVAERSYDSYKDPKGRSGIELNRILPELRRLGILEGTVAGEAWKRNPASNPQANALMPVEINDVYGDADTQAELESINKWAANRKPVIFGGKLGSVPRTMGTLVISGAY